MYPSMSSGDPQCIILQMLGLLSSTVKATVAITTHKGDSFVKLCMIVSFTPVSVHAVNISTNKKHATFGNPTGLSVTAPFPR